MTEAERRLLRDQPRPRGRSFTVEGLAESAAAALSTTVGHLESRGTHAEDIETVTVTLREAVDHAERLHYNSRIDALTGLLRRGPVFQEMQRAVDLAQPDPAAPGAQRPVRSVFVALTDLDNFAALNETHGSEMGDYCLEAVADQLKQLCELGSKVDQHWTAGRIGGDEYLIVIDAPPFVRRPHIEDSFQKVCRKLRAKGIEFSVGIARWNVGWDVDALVQAADERMYEQKSSRAAKPTSSIPRVARGSGRHLHGTLDAIGALGAIFSDRVRRLDASLAQAGLDDEAAEVVRASLRGLHRVVLAVHTAASSDPTTGAHNREQAFATMQHFLDHDGEIRMRCIATVGLDNLKQINDTEGHDAGDVHIKSLADRLNDVPGGQSTLFRIGGAKFLIVSYGDPDKFGAGLAELTSGLKDFGLNVSYGTTPVLKGDTPDALAQRATESMYANRQIGNPVSRIDPDPGLSL